MCDPHHPTARADIAIVTFPFPEADFPVAVMEHATTRYAYPPHTHPFTELVVILGGRGTHQLGETTSTLTAGDVFVVASGNTHAYVDTEGLHLLNVLFQPEVLAPYAAEFRVLPGYHALFTLEPRFRRVHGGRSRLHLAPELCRHATALIAEIRAEATARAPGYRTMMVTALVHLIILLARAYTAGVSAPRRLVSGIGAAVSHIEQAYAEPLTIEALADIAHLSVRHFMRCFRAGTGIAPIEYLLRTRVARAQELLATTESSVATIATAVGFSDSSYFARQFRRITGRSPRAHRTASVTPTIP